MKLFSVFGIVAAVAFCSGLPECVSQELNTSRDSETQLRLTIEQRVPAWAKDAIFYQIFPERFRNGDLSNDPVRESLEFVDIMPKSWRITPWTAQWYKRDQWEKELGDNFYEDGVFHRRFGGDLQGVIDKLDYIKELGVNVIYFNPVFYARSLHKYDGNSFHHVDPYFGPDPAGDFKIMDTETSDPATWKVTAADQLFFDLIKKAHDRGIRVVIDGVFNHTGRDFFAFADIAKNQKDSPYVDWYIVNQFDDPKTKENEFKYEGWWGVDTLPVFADNEEGTDLHPDPKAYIFTATRKWMDPNGDGDPSDGIDGWRLDVANEVPPAFWQQWNTMIRKLNPDAFTVAEIWNDAGDYLGECGFSSTMNYHGFAFPVKGFLIDNRMKASDFASAIQQRMQAHPEDVQYVLQNLIDSHDTDRVASQIVNAKYKRPYKNAKKFDYDDGGRVNLRHFKQYDIGMPNEDERKIQKMVVLFQATFVGAPMFYYGSEAGMIGSDDPDDRMPMIWDDLEYETRTIGPYGPIEKAEVKFDRTLFEFYKHAIALRAGSDTLRQGKFSVLQSDDENSIFSFVRSYEDENILVVFNRSAKPFSEITVPKGFDKATLLFDTNQPRAEITAVPVATRGLSIEGLSASVWRLEK